MDVAKPRCSALQTSPTIAAETTIILPPNSPANNLVASMVAMFLDRALDRQNRANGNCEIRKIGLLPYTSLSGAHAKGPKANLVIHGLDVVVLGHAALTPRT
jgi:hypothetical protein